ncbi:MAG: sulfur oxidation c-type cytochrome SoxA [Rhodospirillaceae bacterium]|nr:MAG: sulfur oxidation c-type cytochrome SoxA [Rhodospirillaceae bacterium]
MRLFYLKTMAVAVLMSATASHSASAGEDLSSFRVGEKSSGYVYAEPETRAMQADDFENPGILWVDEGETLWSEVDGEAGKSCQSCHADPSESMKQAGVSYPKFNKTLGKMQNLEQKINQCREENMKAKPFKYESSQLLGMTAYVRNQSHGMKVNVKIDGEAAPFFEKGKDFYYQRRGQMDLACKHCHEDNSGVMIRANRLSEGQSNGFPTYRLKWQKMGSLHRRFRGCNKNVRAKPYGYGSEEYVNLELYLNWRGNGLQVETPAVRN